MVFFKEKFKVPNECDFLTNNLLHSIDFLLINSFLLNNILLLKLIILDTLSKYKLAIAAEKPPPIIKIGFFFLIYLA